MTPRTRRILCVFMVLSMLIPMFSAFGVSAESNDYVSYADANPGDLLYEADFRGTTGVWENPTQGWDGMTASVASDGSSVTLTPNHSLGSLNRSYWGAELNSAKYPFAGSSYTVTFTVEASDANQMIAFYPDGSSGFVLTPGQNKVSVGNNGNYTKIARAKYYDGTGALTQTYAVEIAEGRGIGASYPDNDVFCSVYNLYVKNGANWQLVWSLSNDVKCVHSDLNTKGQLEVMGWTLNPDDPANAIALRFVRYPITGQTSGTVTISDLNVYKGLNVYAHANKAYADANPGDLLYKADFRGTDGIWENPTQGWDGMATANVATDGSSVTLKPIRGSTNRACWGAALNTANYTAIGSSYTVTFTLEASDDNQFIGFCPDWQTGFMIYPGSKQVSVGRAGNATKIASKTSYSCSTSGAQTYAVEFAVSDSSTYTADGDTYYTVTTYKLYVRDGSNWNLIRELDETQRQGMRWSDTDPEMVLRFSRLGGYSYQTSGTVTVSNLNVYKGLVCTSPVKAYDDAEDGELIYKADFNGTAGTWAPSSGWDGMTASVASDGSSVTLTPNRTLGSNNRSCWGAELNSAKYPFAGSSYTVTFTVEASNVNQRIAFYADGSSGFVLTPGQNKVSIGKYGNWVKIASAKTYEGTPSLTQTYAVEIAEGSGIGATYPGNDIFCSVYNLYVKNGDKWDLIYSMNATQRSKTGWTVNPDDLANAIVLSFVRYPITGQTNGTVTVSNLNVYKGLNVYADANKAYADANPGDLLYQADFRGTDGVWESPAEGWDGMTATVAADGSSVTLTPKTGGNNRSCWGAALNTNNYAAIGSSYTVTFTLEASDNNQFIGFYPDWGTGFIIYPGAKKVSVGQWGNALKVAGDTTYEGDSTVAQTYAVEFAVNNDCVCTVYKLYVKNGSNWELVLELNETQRAMMQWTDSDYEMVLRFARLAGYGNQTSGTVTVSNLNVYKGLTACADANKAYKDANPGDLLYEADFRGTTGVWENPTQGWDGMTASVASDGSSVTLTPNHSLGSLNRSYWGADLNSSKYPFAGSSYTVTFTVEASDANQMIAFYPDGSSGFVLTPGQNKVSVGNNGNYTKIARAKYYDGTGALTQTYAVEIAEGRGIGASYPDNDVFCSVYNLYVKNGANWQLVWSLSNDVKCVHSDLNTKGQLEVMGWTLNPDDPANAIALRFVRYPITGQTSGTVTVSDLNVYKGLTAYADANNAYKEACAGVISVMSYNLETYRSSGGWEGRDPSKAIETVQSNSPDIAGFQEVTTQWNSYINPLTSNGYTWVQGDTTGGSNRTDIVFKTAKFNNLKSGSNYYKAVASALNVENTENADMSLDNQGTKGRMFTYALLEVKSTGEQILVVNTHLHYGGTGSGHEEDDKVRRYEIAILLAWLETQAPASDCQMIMGDMNSHYLSGGGETNMQVYKDGGFGLTCETAVFKGDVGGTLDITGYTTRQPYTFDYIMTKGNTKAVSYTVVDNKIDNGRYPSDHLPILAKVFCY